MSNLVNPDRGPGRALAALLALAATGCAVMRKDTAPLAPIPAQQLQAEIGMTLALGGGYRAELKRL